VKALYHPFSFSKQARSEAALTYSNVEERNLRRRRLTSSVRKRITSYYTQNEQEEIATAAALQAVSLSSFVASATLKEARKIKPRHRPK
jgi:hypothetical protein